MQRVLSAMAVLAVVFCCAPAQAQSDAEAAGQQACGNDAFALCGDAIPDRGRIEACLRKNYRRVSPSCRRYMADYARSHRRVERHHYSRRPERHHHYVRRHHRYHHD